MATVSIVIPCYNEEDNIIQIKEAICEALSGMALDLEFIFVDDGSRDKTWEVLSHLSLADSRVKGLKLSRNFGHQSAILAGLHYARGDCVISMDCDLQHPPSVLPEFINKWQAGSEIVIGIRREQKESGFKRFTSHFFYNLFNFLSDYKIAKNAGDSRLLDRRVLDKILQFHETDLFLRGIVNWMGFNVAHVPYNQPPRLHGDTKYRPSPLYSLCHRGNFYHLLINLNYIHHCPVADGIQNHPRVDIYHRPDSTLHRLPAAQSWSHRGISRLTLQRDKEPSPIHHLGLRGSEQ
jgi:dolichol-phosphate mannosyltransferase